MTDYVSYQTSKSSYFGGIPKEINPLKETQLHYAPTRREKVIASRRKGFQHKKKTELCKHYQIGEPCPKGDSCSFAHGIEELRAKPVSNYKTMKCRHFQEKGWCQYGPRCQFMHNEKDQTIREVKPSYEQLLRIMDDVFTLKENNEIDQPIESFMDSTVNISAHRLHKLDVFASIRSE